MSKTTLLQVNDPNNSVRALKEGR